MALNRKDTDKLFNRIKEAIGSEKLVDEIYQALPTYPADDILKYIAKNYEIE